MTEQQANELAEENQSLVNQRILKKDTDEYYKVASVEPSHINNNEWDVLITFPSVEINIALGYPDIVNKNKKKDSITIQELIGEEPLYEVVK